MHEVDMKALDKLLGTATAMRDFDKCQRLELELRAIEFWDAAYFSNPEREAIEIAAFQARQVRRREISDYIAKTKRD